MTMIQTFSLKASSNSCTLLYFIILDFLSKALLEFSILYWRLYLENTLELEKIYLKMYLKILDFKSEFWLATLLNANITRLVTYLVNEWKKIEVSQTGPFKTSQACFHLKNSANNYGKRNDES